MRVLAFLYGLIAYLLFFGAILYAIGFVEGWGVPKAINDGLEDPIGLAIAVNCLLLLLFALQHNIMARPAFKRWWTRFVPEPIERPTFVLFASLALALAMWQWRPIPATVWHVEAPWARGVLWGVSMLGWGLVFYSTFVIDHFDLFGLRQVWLHLRGKPYHHPPFKERSAYRYVRHPLMLGFVIAFWATPHMTAGHLLFAALSTAFILIGIQLEERDLLEILGEDYRRYRMRTPMLIPMPRTRAAESVTATSER